MVWTAVDGVPNGSRYCVEQHRGLRAGFHRRVRPQKRKKAPFPQMPGQRKRGNVAVSLRYFLNGSSCDPFTILHKMFCALIPSICTSEHSASHGVV